MIFCMKMLRMLKVGRHVGILIELVHQIQAFWASDFTYQTTFQLPFSGALQP